MSETHPAVTVIVPVWNGTATIDACIRSLLAQTYPRERTQLIVVDNASTDDTRSRIAAYPEILLLDEPVAGSYVARNRALGAATGELVLFTDADCRADPDWIERAVAAFAANPHAGVIGGQIKLFAADGPVSPACAALESLFSFNQAHSISMQLCVTANWLSPIALIRGQGGFNPTTSGGDAEMALALSAAGHPVLYAPDMIVHHPIRATLDELRGKYLRTIGGRWLKRRRYAFFRAVAGQSRLAVDRIGRIVRAREFPPALRLRMVGVTVYLLLRGMVETVRLQLGGVPRRS